MAKPLKNGSWNVLIFYLSLFKRLYVWFYFYYYSKILKSTYYSLWKKKIQFCIPCYWWKQWLWYVKKKWLVVEWICFMKDHQNASHGYKTVHCNCRKSQWFPSSKVCQYFVPLHFLLQSHFRKMLCWFCQSYTLLLKITSPLG